jgi:hypothetical protein
MINELSARKLELLEELASLDGMIRGSIVTGMKKCGRKSCDCAILDKAIHPYILLTTTTGVGKTRITYVKVSEERLFRLGVRQYARAKEIINELGEINARLIKSGGK